jgi:hypothetical protein
MPDEKVHEQIGLAISEDGSNFTRVHKDGLILKRDEKLHWKNLRVCNPTVTLCEKKFIMFYQGISKDLNTSIGMARSDDGVNFECEDAPCLSHVDMTNIDPLLDCSKVVRLIEPSIVMDEGVTKMWFVFVHESHPGNSIYYAESKDNHKWKIFDKPVLSGCQFGNFNLHYPQILRTREGYEMWFTLRDNSSYVFGIFRMSSDDGLVWKDVRQVLPKTWTGTISLKKFSAIALGLKRRRLGFNAVSKLLAKDWPNFYGAAHPHLIKNSDRSVLYFQDANSGPRGLYYSIGKAELEEDRVVNMMSVLRNADDRQAWDSFFVADPYVLQC